MAHRSQKAACLILFLALPIGVRAAELQFPVRHSRLLWDDAGTLTVNESGIAYRETGGKGDKQDGGLNQWTWAFGEIQQLYLSPERIKVLSYQDRKWHLGVDHEFLFHLAPGTDVQPLYEFLKARMNSRLVAALPEKVVNPLWESPAKLMGTVVGSQGVLRFGERRAVFETGREEQSRTWRYEDIENISSAGSYQITLTVRERAKAQYGSLKAFNFQLKQPLEGKQFDSLWRRLNQDNQLPFLTAIQEGKPGK